MRWVTPARPFLDADKRYLFLHFPHAVFPMGSWLSTGLTGNEGALACDGPAAG
jgi:2-acylglycerol O-acyltransferase 2